jgi:pimeloyl-ACP methyl ester carboxylesterase
MLALLDSGDAETIHGIGHSAGAVTLLHLASAQPERIVAMVLVDGAHRMSTHGRELLRNESFDSPDPDTQAFYRGLHPGGKEQIETIFVQMNGLADNYRDSSLSPEHLSTLPTRTLLVWGDRAPYFPLEIALEMYRALPSAQLWVVPGQAHTPVWESLGGLSEATKILPAVVQEFLVDQDPK